MVPPQFVEDQLSGIKEQTEREVAANSEKCNGRD
jgi:hypothetical protein